jgi:hypothetical protein
MYGNDKYPPIISSPLASSVPTVVAASRSHHKSMHPFHFIVQPVMGSWKIGHRGGECELGEDVVEELVSKRTF